MQSDTLKELIFALVAAGKLEAEVALSILDTTPEKTNEPLAIVSMALRFPDSENTNQLWDHLVNRHNLVGIFPQERLDLLVQAKPALARQYEHFSSHPAAYAAWLRNIEQFDPEAFGLTAHEAQFMGPSERLFLQVATEGLSKAGYSREALRGSRTGVFVAHSPYPPFEYLKLYDEIDERAFISNIPANLGYHLAYTLDLRGPVLTVNTSCSSSLAAIHLAKNALRQGDCDLAVIGGINLVLLPFSDEEAPDYVVRSPYYRCAAYDAAADGIIGGEGIAVVVLKRLSDALHDHDYIHALIKGSGMSSDGASNGLQVPNPDAQAQAIRAALNDAQVTADSISYVEGHGAGTAVGDLIEVDGLTRAFFQDTTTTRFCRLGSIKSNIGHLGDAAGIAGLIKTTLSLEHKLIPGIVHFQEENPKIGFAHTPFIVSGENTPWNTDSTTPRRAGVNSIGISGTNVHVVLEEFLEKREEKQPEEPVPLFFSAPTRWALWELMQSLTTDIERHEHWSLQDIAFTLNTRQAHEQARIALFAISTSEVIEKLNRLLQVRSFERAPTTFFTQGIFLADDSEARAHSLAHFSHYSTPVQKNDLILIKDFLQGSDVTSRSIQRFSTGRRLPLSVAPFKTKSIWPGNVVATRRDVGDLFFETHWEEYPRTAISATCSSSIEKDTLWLVLSRKDDQVMPTVRERLRASGAQTILILPGPGFARTGDDIYEIAIEQPESFTKLFNLLGAEKLSHLAGIVHGCTLKPVDKTMETLEELESSQDEGVFSLFGLVKAVLAYNLIHPLQLTVVSSQVEQVLPEEGCVPSRVTTFGLARVISQERPTISYLTIDHDLSGNSEQIAEQIFAEMTDNSHDRRELIAYRHGTRLTKLVERQPNIAQREIPIREGGTYVIAGGTGYLGMQVGLFLSERANVSIVLLARTPLPERKRWEQILLEKENQDEALIYKLASIQTIEMRGSQVHILPCDVTNPEAVSTVFSQIRTAYGPIHGAFMLVKQLYHLWLHELTFAQFRNGIYNRVKGTWLIEKEIRSPELDFFILFSSISSLMGTKSASECCAVNQFLDAMSGYLNQRGIPAHVLNLTLILDDKRDFGSRTPIPPIDFVDFQSALIRFFQYGHPWNLVSRFDMEEVHFLKPVLKIPFGPAFWQEVEEVTNARYKKTEPELKEIAPASNEAPLNRATIEQRLTDVWRKVLGIDNLHRQDNFFACGGSSLSALRFVQLFRKGFSAFPFAVADLYSMPTYEAQVAYCEQILCPKDELAELFEALENDSISTEAALALFEKSQSSTKEEIHR